MESVHKDITGDILKIDVNSDGDVRLIVKQFEKAIGTKASLFYTPHKARLIAAALLKAADEVDAK